MTAEIHNYQQQEMEKAIVKTIVFFDIFNYPLTAWEIWQYLGLSCPFQELSLALENPVAGIEEKNGFYFLAGRGEIIEERMKRYNYSDQKIKIAQRATKLFSLLPWLETVAVSNIIGSHNLRQGSDVDLFIITRPQRIWLSRLFCAGLMAILNQRPRPGRKENKICLSFYIDSNSLDLRKFRLDAEDIYFHYWLLGLVPIFDRNGSYQNLLATNLWLRQLFPNYSGNGVSPRRHRFGSRRLERNKLFDGLEKLAKRFQLSILPQALKELANRDSRVIISDQILKLYLSDRREELRSKFRENLKKYE